MARTAITPATSALPGVATAQPAPIAIDQANGMVLAAPLAAAYGITPRPATPDRTLWIINNTTVSSKVVTFRKGINPPAFRADIGDLNLTLAASTTYYIPSPDPSRFEQADGSINVDFAAGMTGTIAVVGLPQASF